MTERTLAALGLADLVADDPLHYPGSPVREPGLLVHHEFLPLTPLPGRRLGHWSLRAPGDDPLPLNAALIRLNEAEAGQRYPVLAVGANASPAQMAYKMERHAIPAIFPMVPVTVSGIRVGVSAHISAGGYVSASPCACPDVTSTLVASWLDMAQLEALDTTEPNYHRALVDGDTFRMVMPSGENLGQCYLYVNKHGVLTDESGEFRRTAGQRELITALLTDSPELRDLFGETPDSFVRTARGSEAARLQGAAIFAGRGWVTRQPDFDAAIAAGSTWRVYDDIAPPTP